MPEIIINSNGTVTPEGFIERSGNTYTLVRDVKNFSLSIERSNVILDGSGHTITVVKTNSTLDIMNTGLMLYRVTNITVKDLQVTGFHEGIDVHACLNCTLIRVNVAPMSPLHVTIQAGGSNTINQSAIGTLNVVSSNRNVLTQNVIDHLRLELSDYTLVTDNNVTSLSIQACKANTYCRNNFLSAGNYFYKSGIDSSWDNGSIGNYWLDYPAKFPNASENGNSGIWNIPYQVNETRSYQTTSFGELVNMTWVFGYVIDRYPLMKPLNNTELQLPTSSPSPNSIVMPSQINPLVALLSVAIIVTLASLLFFLNRRLRRNVTV